MLASFVHFLSCLFLSIYFQVVLYAHDCSCVGVCVCLCMRTLGIDNCVFMQVYSLIVCFVLCFCFCFFHIYSVSIINSLARLCSEGYSSRPVSLSVCPSVCLLQLFRLNARTKCLNVEINRV